MLEFALGDVRGSRLWAPEAAEGAETRRFRIAIRCTRILGLGTRDSLIVPSRL